MEAEGSSLKSIVVFVGCGKKVAAQCDGHVLFAGTPEHRGPFPGRGGYGFASWEGNARSELARWLEAAASVPELVCIATSDGTGLEPPRKAGKDLLVERVLPTLTTHFDAMAIAETDTSPWMLTHVIAALISTRPSAAALDAALGAIEASLGRGDATSTRQNLQAATNFLYYAEKNDPAMADAARAKRPVLEGLRVLADSRLWPHEHLAEGLRAGLRTATERHGRAAVQIGTRVVSDHGSSPERITAVLDAASSVSGFARWMGDDLDHDLVGVARRRIADLRHRGTADAELRAVGERVEELAAR